jgi:hypothetical protein
MILTEWMSQIKDYQGNPLFINILPPVNNKIEAHTLSTNTALAFEWERNAISHIAREIDTNQYNKGKTLYHFFWEIFTILQIQTISPTNQDTHFW